MTQVVSTARRVSIGGAVYRSEADELQLDLEYVERKYPDSECKAHFLEVNRRRLTMEAEHVNGRDAAADNVARGLCGCGRTTQAHGRCWYRRLQDGKGRAAGGGQTKPVKEKRSYSKRVPVSKPVVASSVPHDSLVDSLRAAMVVMQIEKAKLDEAITSIEKVIAVYEPQK